LFIFKINYLADLVQQNTNPPHQSQGDETFNLVTVIISHHVSEVSRVHCPSWRTIRSFQGRVFTGQLLHCDSYWWPNNQQKIHKN